MSNSQKEINFDFNYQFKKTNTADIKKEVKKSFLSKFIKKASPFLPSIALTSLTVLALNNQLIHINKGWSLTTIEILFYISFSLVVAKDFIVGKSMLKSMMKSGVLLIGAMLIKQELKKFGIQIPEVGGVFLNMLMMAGGLGFIGTHPSWSWNKNAH